MEVWKEFVIKCLPLFCHCIVLFLILEGLSHAVIQFCGAFVSCLLLCYTLTASFLYLLPSLWLVHRHCLPSQAFYSQQTCLSVTQTWYWREKKDGLSTLLSSPIPHKPAAEEEALHPSPAVTPGGCSTFRGKGGESHQVHSAPHHTPDTGKSWASLRCISRSHCSLSHTLFALDFMINSN